MLMIEKEIDKYGGKNRSNFCISEKWRKIGAMNISLPKPT